MNKYTNLQKYINGLKISLASPEDILNWSYGEVVSANTINYKTKKPEPGGIFDEIIFGPIKSYSCSCGKYNSPKFAGKVCEKCGVEVTNNIVRRERMGHISLNTFVVNPWFVEGTTSKISTILNIKGNISKVIYYESWIVLNNTINGNKYFEKNEILSLDNNDSKQLFSSLKNILENIIKPTINNNYENEISTYDYVLQICNSFIDSHDDKSNEYLFDEILHYINQKSEIKFGIGGEAIYELLKNINLTEEKNIIESEINTKKNDSKDNAQIIKQLKNRLNLIKWFLNSNTKPEWMCLKDIPVTPPDTRPFVETEQGVPVASDINELYRNLISRNNNLKDLMENDAPANIIMTEKRLIQSAVDCLFENESTPKPRTDGVRPLKSLSEKLKGKYGLFRQNLLGKRVDYSARSVIVGAPDLKIYQVGMPIGIALKLFEPFIISEIKKMDEFSNLNVKEIIDMINKRNSIILTIIEKLVKERPVLLNRAPTLHKYGIQAFEIVLTNSDAIRLHPLMCTGFNADFDGDTMAIHLPITKNAVNEARTVMLSTNNIISAKDGKPLITPTIDMLVGIYYLTLENKKANGTGMIFATINDAIKMYKLGLVDLHAIVGISTNNYQNKQIEQNKIMVTTVGKIIFNNILPDWFTYVNDAKITNTVEILPENTSIMDYIKERKLNTAISKKQINDIIIELYKKTFGGLYTNFDVCQVVDNIKNLGFEYATKSGTTFSVFDLPKYDKKDEYIKEAEEKVEEYKQFYYEGLLTDDERYLKILDIWGGVKDKVTSDMKKIIDDPDNIYNSLIIMNKSGARGNVSQFTQLLGLRGLMTKTFNYANSTSTIPHDIIENPIKTSYIEGSTILDYFNGSYGARKGMADVALKTGKSGYMTRKLVDSCQDVVVNLDDCGATVGLIVSKLTNPDGGIIETLSERIVGKYIVHGIEGIIKDGELITKEIANKIENSNIQSVEVRSVTKCKCKNGVCAKCFGLDLTKQKDIEIGSPIGIISAQTIGEPITQINMRSFHSGGVAGGAQIAQGYERIKQLLEVLDPKEYELSKLCTIDGNVKEIFVHVNELGAPVQTEITIQGENMEEKKYKLNKPHKDLLIKVGDFVKKGDKLNKGSISLNDLLEINGMDATVNYIISEVQNIYKLNGIDVNDKYLEIVISQMMNKWQILDTGDSNELDDSYIEVNKLNEINEHLIKNNLKPIVAKPDILGLIDIPTYSNSFLSAASFQYTKKHLINACLKGQIDELKTIKECVILGKLIPAGTSLSDITKIEDDACKIVSKEY